MSLQPNAGVNTHVNNVVAEELVVFLAKHMNPVQTGYEATDKE